VLGVTVFWAEATMEEMRVSKCHTCGHVRLHDGEAELTRVVCGRTFVGRVPAQVCPQCGEWVVTDSRVGQFEAAVARALVASGIDQGEAVRWLRTTAGLRGVDLAEMLGVVPETVSRWETGRTTIDRATLHPLGRLAIEAGEGCSDTAAALRAMGTPRKLPEIVRVDAAA